MKTAFIATALVLIIFHAAHAGMAQAELICVSDNGKTKVSAIIPGDSEESGVIFSIEGRKLAYVNQSMKDDIDLNKGRLYPEFANAQIVEMQSRDQIRRQQLDINVSAVGQSLLHLSAIRGTARIVRTPNGQRGSFRSTVQGVDPRTMGASKLIEVTCKYRYEI